MSLSSQAFYKTDLGFYLLFSSATFSHTQTECCNQICNKKGENAASVLNVCL